VLTRVSGIRASREDVYLFGMAPAENPRGQHCLDRVALAHGRASRGRRVLMHVAERKRHPRRRAPGRIRLG
jgi:hypothetical protein